MIKSVVFASLGTGNILVEENEMKENPLEIESQNVGDKSKLISPSTEIPECKSPNNKNKKIFNTLNNIDSILDLFCLENFCLINENTKINPEDVIQFHFPYELFYDEDKCTFRIVSSFVNMYESMNKTDIIVSIPSYYSSSLMESKIKKIIELCDYKNVEILPDYEAIGLSYAYKNKEELKETKNVMILQIDSISASSSIIHMNTKKFKMLSSSYDGYLGDRIIDKMIYEYISNKLEKDEEIILNDQSHEFKINLMEMIKCLKYELKDKESVNIVLDNINGKDFTIAITNNEIKEFINLELTYSFSPSNYENKSIFNTMESRLVSIIKDSIIKSKLNKKEMNVLLVGKILYLKPFQNIIQTCLKEVCEDFNILNDYNSYNECEGCYYKSLINDNIWKYEIQNRIIKNEDFFSSSENEYNNYIKEILENYKNYKNQSQKYKNELKELISFYHDIFMSVYKINDKDNNNDRQYKHKIISLFCNEKKILSSQEFDEKKLESYKCLINKGLEEIKEEYKDILIEEITKYKTKSEEFIHKAKMNDKKKEKIEKTSNEIQKQIYLENDILKLQEMNNKIESMLFICEETTKEIDNYYKQISTFDILFKELKDMSFELQSFTNLNDYYIQYSNNIHSFTFTEDSNGEEEEEQPPAIQLKNKSKEIEIENEKMKVFITTVQTTIKHFKKIERQRKRLPNTLPDSIDINIVSNIDNIIVKIKQKLISNFKINKLEVKYYENLNEEIEKCKNLLDELLPKCQIQISQYFTELQQKILEYNDIYSQMSKFQKNILDISLEMQNYLYKAERDNYNGIEIAEVEIKIQEVENKILDLKQMSIDYISKILRPEIKLKINELKDILFYHPEFSEEIYKFIMDITHWVNTNKKDSNSLELFNEKIKEIQKFIDDIYNTKLQTYKLGEKVIYITPKIGIISHINKDGTYHISCEDGNYFINIPYNEIKLFSNNNNNNKLTNLETTIHKNKKYKIGDHIKVKSIFQSKVIKSILLGINNDDSTCDIFYPPNCIEKNIPLKNIQSPLLFCIKKFFKRLNQKYIYQVNETVEWIGNNNNNKNSNKKQEKIRGKVIKISNENNTLFYEILTSEETNSCLTHIPYKEIIPVKSSNDKIYGINDNIILQECGYEGTVSDFDKHSKTYQITFQNGNKINHILPEFIKPIDSSINDKNIKLFFSNEYRIGDTVNSYVFVNNKMKKMNCQILNIYKNKTFDLCIKNDIIFKNISSSSLETSSSEFMKYEIGDEIAYRFMGSFIFYYGVIVGYSNNKNDNFYNIKSGKFYEENVPSNYIRKMSHPKNNNNNNKSKESDMYFINNDKICITNGSVNPKTNSVNYSFIYCPIELGNNNNNNNIIETIDKNIDIIFYDNEMKYEKSKSRDEKDNSKIIRRKGNSIINSLSLPSLYNNNNNCIILYKPGDIIIYYFYKKWYIGHILYYYNGTYKIQPGEKLLKQNENGIVTCESEYIRHYKDKTNQKFLKGDIVIFKTDNNKYKIGIISKYNNNNYYYTLLDKDNKIYENISSKNITYCNYHNNSTKKGLTLPIYEVGDKVKAKYGKEHYYKGIINKINENGTVNILFEDGDYKENIEFSDIKFKQNKDHKHNNNNNFLKNENVIYKRNKHNKWRIGIINSVNDNNNNNKYTVVNEDGKLIQNSEIECIKKYKDYTNYIFKIGDEVKYSEYPNNIGIINRIKSNGNYEIYFKDIEVYMNDINKRRIEISNNNSTLLLNIGKHVFVNYHNKNRYYDGIINKINNNYTYNIYYNDNDYEENVKLERIRIISLNMNSEINNNMENSFTEQISYYTNQSDSSISYPNRNSSEYFMNMSNRSPIPIHFSSFLPRKSPVFNDDECKECNESDIESDHKIPSSIESPNSYEVKKMMSFPVIIDNVQIEMV